MCWFQLYTEFTRALTFENFWQMPALAPAAGSYVPHEQELGFIEALLVSMMQHLPNGDLSPLVRGSLAPLQLLQASMTQHLMEDLLGHASDQLSLVEGASEMAESLIDTITIQDLIEDEDEASFPQTTPGEDALRALHGRLLPSVDLDNLLRQCLVRHSRLFLHLVTGEPVVPTSEHPHPFAYGLRRWLGWMLGDLMTQLSASFSGGRHDALLFLRNLLNVRLAHATAALSAHGYTRRGVDAPFAEGSDTMISDMLALIDTHHHETFTEAD
jgi:hypothetical protein